MGREEVSAIVLQTPQDDRKLAGKIEIKRPHTYLCKLGPAPCAYCMYKSGCKACSLFATSQPSH